MQEISIKNNNLNNGNVFKLTIDGTGKIIAGNMVTMRYSNLKYKNIMFTNVKEKVLTDKLKTVAYIDIPVRLPLESRKRYDFYYEDKMIRIFHTHKLPGEENFDSFNTKLLPEFSSLEMILPYQNIEPFYDKSDFSDTCIVTKHIMNIIKKFIDRINEHLDRDVAINIDIFSYELHYFEEGNTITFRKGYPNKPDFSIYVFYDGTLKLDGSDYRLKKSEHDALISALMKEESKLEKYFASHLFEKKEFIKRIDEFICEFCFYCSNSRKLISKLGEDRVRDLLLIPAKLVFGNGEGEAFNYDGKSDFKITNPESIYEYVIGEFKIWKGVSSFSNALYQGRKKHSSRYEETVYIIMVSDNKDFNEVNNKVTEYILEDIEVEINNKNKFNNIGNRKQPMYEFFSINNGKKIRFVATTINRYFESA